MLNKKHFNLTIVFALLLFCANKLLAQNNNGTYITSNDAGWDNEVPDSLINKLQPILIETNNSAIFDLTGKKIETDDISTLPAGIYIQNGRKFIIH